MIRAGSGGVDRNKLISLIGATIDAREQAKEITSEVRADLADAVNNYGLNPSAFNLCLRVARMDQVKRVAFLSAFDSYRHILALDDAPQAELLPEPPTQMRPDNG